MTVLKEVSKYKLDLAWGLGMRLTTLHHKNKFVTKNETEPRTWTDSLDKLPK
jgi:hypothetical protein